MSLKRREFITFLRGAAAWPPAARAQGQSLPVVGFLAGRAAEPWLASFREGLRETGYIENQNVTVEYHWLDGEYDRDFVRRRVAVIATSGGHLCRSRPARRKAG